MSWCADQCGYIKSGTIPKFAGVGTGVDWFKARGQFQRNSYKPAPGDIIFFDWGADGNYRSTRSIVDTGNLLIANKTTSPAKAHRSEEGIVRIGILDDFESTPDEYALVQEGKAYYDDLPVLRMIRYALKKGQKVVLLFRTRGLLNKGYLKYIRSFFPDDKRDWISATTVHKYKGAQENIVIVMDAFKRKYPLIHPTWSFYRIFDDDIRNKLINDGLLGTVGDVTLSNLRLSEKRLFYVAISRAENEMFILTKKDNESEFLIDSDILYKTQRLNWFEYIDTHGKLLFTIKVSNSELIANTTGEIKDLLKKDGFKWSGEDKCWYKSFYLNNEGDDLPVFEEEWYKAADMIDIDIHNVTSNEAYKLCKTDGKLFRRAE